MLTVIAELKLFLNQDPYRQRPGQDLEGQNIFRVSLKRLETLAELTPDEYDDVLAFARGECLERLGEWAQAREAFDIVASPARASAATPADAESTTATAPTSFAEVAKVRAESAARMATLTDRVTFAGNLQGYLNELDVLRRRLEDWIAERPPFPYESYARVEMERALAESARLNFNNRLVLAEGAAHAIAQMRSLIDQNATSCRYYDHWLLAGGMYEALARDLAMQADPDGLDFAEVQKSWTAYVSQAREAYRRVAQADGQPAKPEGQARLRALDAYDLRLQAQGR